MDLKTRIWRIPNATKLIVIIFALAIILYIYMLSNTTLGSHPLSGSPCQYFLSGFYCTNPIMHPNGTVYFLISQETGATLYNVHFACTVVPTNASANTNLYYDLLNISSGLHNDSLINNQLINVTALPCYGRNGTILSSRPTNPQDVHVWINYTTNSSAPSSRNPWISSGQIPIIPKNT